MAQAAAGEIRDALAAGSRRVWVARGAGLGGGTEFWTFRKQRSAQLYIVQVQAWGRTKFEAVV